MNSKKAKKLRRAIRMQERIDPAIAALKPRDYVDLGKVQQRISNKPAPSRIMNMPDSHRGIYRQMKKEQA